MEEKLKKLEAIKEELKKINLEKELTEKDKEKYIKNLEEFGKISTDVELYDEIKNVVEETEGNFDNPTTDKSMEELKRINELQNKYKSIVKDNISKRIEIIEEYAKKFDIEDLLENKQSKIIANEQTLEDNTKTRIVLEKLQTEIKGENDKLIECNNVLEGLNSIKKAINEAEKIQAEIDTLTQDNTVEEGLKNSQIELRKNKMKQQFEKINQSADKYNKFLEKHKIGSDKLPEVKELSEAKALQITTAEIIVNVEKTDISDNIIKIKDAKEKELQELGIEFDDAIEGEDLNGEINKKKTELRLQKGSLRATNESLTSTIDAIQRSQAISNDLKSKKEEKDKNKIIDQYKKDVEQKRDELYDEYQDLPYKEKVKQRFNILKIKQEQESNEVKGFRKALLGLRSLFGIDKEIDNYMLEEAKTEVKKSYKQKAQERKEAESKANNFKDQYKMELVNKVMSEKDVSKINDQVVDEIYDNMNSKNEGER